MCEKPLRAHMVYLAEGVEWDEPFLSPVVAAMKKFTCSKFVNVGYNEKRSPIIGKLGCALTTLPILGR